MLTKFMGLLKVMIVVVLVAQAAGCASDRDHRRHHDRDEAGVNVDVHL